MKARVVGLVIGLLKVLCPFGIATCFLVWFPPLLESVALRLLSYGVGAFHLAGVGLVVLGYILRLKDKHGRRILRRSGTQN